MEGDYLSAAEAAERLGVNLQTLYVYVSRKGIRSRPVPGTRQKQYWREDIERIRRRETHGPAVGPSGESAITLISDGALYYRGQDAVRLSESATFEAVAALLWDVAEAQAFAAAPPASRPLAAAVADLVRNESDVTRALTLLPLLEDADPKAYDLSRAGMARTGADILRWLAALVTFADAPSAAPIHTFIGERMALRAAETDLVRRLLVLAADHGFEASTIAARSIAGGGVTPWRAVIGGFCVTVARRSKSGNLTSIGRFVSEVAASVDPLEPVIRRVRDGEPLPGFDPGLYPQGDPRAKAIFDQARHVYDGDIEHRRMEQAFAAAREIRGVRPNFALACLFVGRKIGLAPRHTLFNVGRAAGWIAHAIEQHELGEWVHPAGSYSGPAPQR
ncbi:citrate/2-methylcitrate synthase [Caulobacter sp. KR2-114]|uniref:citrate/2-methylcitrate synthase n=1 Tax=Caulobacter sp. KR2-114 TaxID=3400912 RepID=UPI003C0080B1